MVRERRVNVESASVKPIESKPVIKLPKSTKPLVSQTFISKLPKRALKCIGEVCFTEDGHIQIDLTKSKCSQEVIDQLVKRVFKGAETRYLMGKREAKTKEVK